MDSLLERQKHYLLRCQLPSGTFRLAPESNVINPYFTNLALVSLARLGECAAVERHVDWYLAHLSERGFVNDFRLDGETETDTGKADSEDSYHATLFSLLAKTIQGNKRTDLVAARRDKLLTMLRALLHLQQSDGLTWAKQSHKVKYLMDNCEVLEGLENAAFLFALVGDRETAILAKERADRCRAGLARMYDSSKRCFAVYDRVYPSWTKWYPDATSQAFPLLYRLVPADSAIAVHLFRQITSHFPHFATFQTGDLYPWMVMGECAWLMGDTARAERMCRAAEDLYIFGPRQKYWLIHEAAAYIRLRLLAEENGSGV
jgi:hypothetical protein